MTARRAATVFLGRPRFAVAAVVLVSGLLGLGIRYVAEPSGPHGVFGGPTAPPAVEALLADLFLGDDCRDPIVSEKKVRERLSAAGLADWSVRIRPEVKPTDCVGAASDVKSREVVLTVAMRPEIRSAIKGVADKLLLECFNRNQAERLLRDALASAGASTFELRTDGSEAGPIEREAEIHAHFEAGCWIYSVSGWRADGTPIYVIGGKS